MELTATHRSFRSTHDHWRNIPFRGLDLFNHGYYWEAHEAWEGLWQVADRDGTLRTLFKGLILLSAAGVKIRERKNAAAARHAKRAAALLRQLMKVPDRAFERALGMSPAALAECAEGATRIPADLQATAPGEPRNPPARVADSERV
jgi:predicted metal-dependent hydrolase